MAGCRTLISYAQLIVNLAFFIRQSESNRIDIDLKSKFILGGLFPIHGRGPDEHKPCGLSIKEKNVQRVEAMLYALDLIKEQKEFESMGATIFDTCASDSYALEKSLNFLKMRNCGYFSPHSRKVAAVIGAANSQVSMAVASILRLFKTPQVSYASSSEKLDDVNKYPYFFRVVPSSKFQIEVMFDIIKYLKWTYLSAVTSEGGYGEMAISKLKIMIKQSHLDICLATVQILPRDPKPEDYKRVIEKLYRRKRARAVVLFLHVDKVRQLLNASQLLDTRRHFLWLGSNSFGAQLQAVEHQEELAEGAITISAKSAPLEGFKKHFLSLNPKNNERNPWFREFWESHFNCTLSARDPYVDSSVKPNCTGDEDLSKSYNQEGLVPMVVDSVFVVAHALRSLSSKMPDIKDTDPSFGALLKEEMTKVVFNSSQRNGLVIHFNKDRSIQVSYSIYQFRKIKAESGWKYDYVLIGEWNPNRRLVLWNETKWRIHGERYQSNLISSCSDPCNYGERRQIGNQSCCWSCKPCYEDQYILNVHSKCKSCPPGYVPDTNRNSCRQLKPQSIGGEWTNPWVLIPILLSSFGILFTIFTAIVFTVFGETPIIKASGKELCYVMFVGIILCYSFTFITVQESTRVTCGAVQVGLGLGLTICYSAIFTKTNRISRIFSSANRPAYISPRSQLIIVLCLVCIQLILSAILLIISPPAILHRMMANPSAHLVTCAIDRVSIGLNLMYNLLLIILCTVYAYKTRNTPENFNEAKCISFTMYSSCVVWIIFVAVYVKNWNKIQVYFTVLCLSVSLSGTFVLVFLYFPKLYLVLFKPHKNIRSRLTVATPERTCDVSAQGPPSTH